MKRLLTFLIVLSASSAFSQGLEVSALAGYTTPGAIDHSALGITELKLDRSFTWGATASVFFPPPLGVGAAWGLPERSLHAARSTLGVAAALCLHGGGAEALRERLPAHRWLPDAVLRGLARWHALRIA